MKRWVILSCTPDSAYDFFLPIAVRLWRNRIGYEPVVVLVGAEGDWSSGHSGVVYGEIREKERIEFFRGIPDLPDSTVSQGLRQHVSALDFGLDDVLLVGDVDLLPVDRGFYHRYDPSMGPVGIYYADMYDQYWPAYGMLMPVRNWREVMGVTVGDLRGSVERTFMEGGIRALVEAHKVDHCDMRSWIFDETYTSLKIRNSRFFGAVVKFSSLLDGKRPCRVKLPRQPNAFDYVDFHCSRPGWNGENWPGIRQMLAQLLPDDLQWVDRYVGLYRASL